MPSAAASSRLALSESCSSGSGPIMAQISWSLVMPSALRMTTTGTSSPMVLCCSCRRPVRSTMTVRDLRSCVDDVTLALTECLVIAKDLISTVPVAVAGAGCDGLVNKHGHAHVYALTLLHADAHDHTDVDADCVRDGNCDDNGINLCVKGNVNGHGVGISSSSIRDRHWHAHLHALALLHADARNDAVVHRDGV